MTSRTLSALAVIGLLLTSVSSPSSASATAAEVELALRTEGAKRTLTKYFACDGTPGNAYSRIASGYSRWIALAETLIKQSDGCYTEGLQSSLGEAMQKSPRKILPLVNSIPQLGAEYICLPFISDEGPAKLQLAEVGKSRTAIEQVREGEFMAARSACLKFIGDVQAAIMLKAKQSAAATP